MQIVINIPKEFEKDFNKDRFTDTLCRLGADAHVLAGYYEQETAVMLAIAFQDACVLPKEHGRLIDAEAIKMLDAGGTYTAYHFEDIIEDTQTIINAERENL